MFLVAVAGLGLLSRHYPVGWAIWDKSVGDLCYGAAAFLGLGIFLPRFRPGWVALQAFLFCVAIECFKLTGIPREWGSHALARIVFGSTFSWHNIGCYAAGIAAMLGVEWIGQN